MQAKKEPTNLLNEKKHSPANEVQKNTSLAAFDNIEKLQFKLLSENDKPFLSNIFDCYKISSTVTKTAFWLANAGESTIWLSPEFVKMFNIGVLDTAILSLDSVLKKINTECATKIVSTIKLLTEGNPQEEFDYSHTDDLEPKQVRTYNFKILLMPKNASKQRGILGIVTDISDRQRYEDELAKAKEKAEESDRVKTTFLGNISHEIRTPMNAIIGFTELLNIGDQSAEKKREYLSIIKSKSKQLLSLIDDIVELSKFESGDISLNHTETNLAKLLTEIHQDFDKEKVKRNKQNIDIYLKLPIDQNIISLNTDPGRIQQVLNYLIDNALKFTEKGYVQIGYDLKDSRHIQFFVKDTGIGISKEAQKYLFNRFRVKEEVYDRKHSHTGLGLTISRAIVELMGGKIHVDSIPGQGATFYFTIPLLKPEKHVEIENNNEAIVTNWRNRVILVAEDDEVNFKFLEAVFSETHAQLLHVLDGKQAVELCHTIAKIDLILMDIRMPEKSGYDAVREIKKFRKDIPIIAQTAYTSKDDRKKCIEAGCDDYISKPIDIEQLFTKINQYFND